MLSTAMTLAPAGADATFPGQPGTIAFQSTRAGGLSIWLVNPDGSGLRRFTPGSAGRRPTTLQFAPAISADGRRVAYVTSQEIGDRTWRNVYLKGIGVRDPRTPGLKILRRPLPSAIDSVAFLPSGSRLIFSAIWHRRGGPDFELFVVRLNGTDLERLTSNRIQDVEADVSIKGRIAYSRVHQTGTPRFGAPYGPSDISLIWPTGERRQTITGGPAQEREPSFSPDGRRVVYERTPAGKPDATQIAETDLRSRRSRLVLRPARRNGATDSIGSPTFSPEGDRILFDRTRYNFPGRESFNADLFELRLEGTGTRRITGTADDYETDPDWGPAPITPGPVGR